MAERFMVRVAVFVILRNDKGEILLQRRAQTNYLDGYWDLPSGHVERGESLRDTAVRELLEEVGVRVVVEELKLVNIDQVFLNHDYINFTFEAKHWQGEPKICEPQKCSAIGWFAPDALPDKCVNVVRVNERTGFSEELTYAVVDESAYKSLMGEPFPWPRP